MKFSIYQTDLQQALSIVGRAVNPRSTLPILANVHLKAEMGDTLTISATNLELGIKTRVQCGVKMAGATTLPARTFTELVGSYPKEIIDLELDPRAEIMKMNCGKAKTQLKGVPAEEFPPMPDVEMQGAVEFPVKAFREITQQVIFSASQDEARPVLTGVLVEISGKLAQFASADGFRLSSKTYMLDKDVTTPIKAIIPAKALVEVARLADGDAVQMLLREGRGQVVFQCGNTEITSQLLDGNFPDFRQVVPKSCATTVTVDTTAFVKACKQAEIFARESSNIAKLTIAGHMMTISSTSEETGQNETELEAEIDGSGTAGLTVAFNVRFLREALEVFRTSRVTLELNNAASPGVLVAPDDRDYLHVIMPMHF